MARRKHTDFVRNKEFTEKQAEEYARFFTKESDWPPVKLTDKNWSSNKLKELLVEEAKEAFQVYVDVSEEADTAIHCRISYAENAYKHYQSVSDKFFSLIKFPSPDLSTYQSATAGNHEIDSSDY